MPQHTLPTRRAPLRFATRAALCAALCLLGTARAQDTAAPALPLWEAGVFAGALSTPAYPASSERNQRALVLPFLVYRGEVLRADRNGVGARMVNTERFEFDIGFSGSLPASSNDIALRQGMPDLGTLIEFGPRAKLTLAEPAPGERATLELPLRAVLEFNGGVRQVGNALEPKLAYEWRERGDWRVKSAIS
ncbi:MAG: MipA/OmpV family protein, partial [Rhodoferax sp.]|nr:MipA/OmpV family protein [Rhodoferax sp.]